MASSMPRSPGNPLRRAERREGGPGPLRGGTVWSCSGGSRPASSRRRANYAMKMQILMMLQTMHEVLFDALPSVMQDEELYTNGELDAAIAGEPPLDAKSAEKGDQASYEGTRVARSRSSL